MRRIYLFVLLLFVLSSCNSNIIAEDLIGGEWVATTGYKNGEIKGEPNCIPFEDGNKFKEKGIVYNKTYEENAKYEILDDNEIVITIKDIGTYRYQIKMLNENEMVFEGIGVGSQGHSCYMERK